MVDQADDLRMQMNEARNLETAKTISFISGKGGVGKSTLSLNIAIEMQQRGKKVLLIDLDIGMGNMEVLLGIQAKQSIVDLFEKRCSFSDIIQYGPMGLSFIAGGTGFSKLPILSEADIAHFFKEYKKLLQQYDYIFFDMGAGIDKISLAFILASDECIVVTTPEPTALTDAYSMVKLLLTYDKLLSIGIIINRVSSMNQGSSVAYQFSKIVGRFLQKKMYIVGIFLEDLFVSKSIIQQKPFILFHPYRDFTQEIKRIISHYVDKEKKENHHSLSFIDKLKTFIRKR